jgi:hypothetical protein
VNRIDPPPVSFMARAALFASMKYASRSTDMTRRQEASVMSRKCSFAHAAALLIITSSFGSTRSAVSIASVQLAISPRSQQIGTGVPPAAVTSDAVFSSRSASRSTMYTFFAPSCAKSSAIRWPKPLPAPVMNTFLPSSRPMTLQPPDRSF